ncbi:MAG: 4'-phosphopantetheinyl transferase superfamily protein [Bryobacteraceae bacterium]
MRTRASETLAAEFQSLLASDERDRASRFRFEHLRQLFVIRRGALRCLLGRYLDLDPANIWFNYGSKGKPALASATGVEFNTTHSGDVAAFAFTLGCPIGLDLEQVRPLKETQDIADRFFCSEEAEEMMSLPPSERERAFFCCWTRKEAYVKAIGDGLSAPLDTFRVTVRPDEPAHFIHLANDTNAARVWTLQDLCLASDCAAALAYRDQARPLSVFPIADPAEFISMP